MNTSMKHILPVSFLLLLLAVFTTNIYSQTFSFSSDLSAWEDKLGNTWSIENEELRGNYSITCGSSTCPHGDLILKDEYQLTDNWKASIDFIRVVDVSHSTYYTAMASFSVWYSKDKKIMLRIGGGGWESWGGSQDSVSIRVGEWDGSWETALRVKLPYQWNPDEWHTGSIVKNGKNYKFYIDGLLLTEYTDTFLNGEGSVGLHTYGTKRYDNFILEPASNIPTDGLVAYYPFNGNANDESGSGYNGTVSGATLTTDRFGNTDSAFEFDGNDDYIDVGSSTAFNGPIAITVSAWIHPNSTVQQVKVVTKGKNVGGDRSLYTWDFTLSPSNQAGKIRFDVSDGSNHADVISNNSAKAGSWHHVVGTFDGSVTRVYMDGILEDSSTAVSRTLNNETGPLQIGRENSGGAGNGEFDGAIDDIRIYNYALSEAEISDLYHENGWTDDYFSNEFLTFDDNQIPTGWEFVETLTDCKIENGRINAYVVDAHGYVKQEGTMPQDAEQLTLEWDGNIEQSGWGIQTSLYVWLGDKKYFRFAHLSNQANLGSQNRYYISFSDSSSHQYLVDKLIPQIFCDVHYTVMISPTSFQYKGINKSTNEALFNETITIADFNTDFNFMEISELHFRVGATTTSSAWLDNISVNVVTSSTDVAEMKTLPQNFSLHQNYPNPFNPETNISFQLSEVTDIILKIYNIKGQLINTLINTRLNAGYHNIIWNGKDNNGKNVAGGIYFYSIRATNNNSGTFCLNKKMILLK